MDYLTGLNNRQLEAVEYGEGPLLILAGAGSGKTRVLVARAAHLIENKIVKPYQILALTFTNKAAEEMRSRLVNMIGADGISVVAGTFHSIFARILRQQGFNIGLDPHYTIFDSDDRRKLIKTLLKEQNIPNEIARPATIDWMIGNRKQELISPEQYAASASSPLDLVASRIFKIYEKRLHQMNALDFDDLLGVPLAKFDEYPEFLTYLQNRFSYVMVDEFQDTNRVQYTLVQRVAESHGNIFVVGDDDQSIYGWRGANVGNILEFERDWKDTRVIKLEQNYRSTKTILEAAWSVVSNNRNRKAKKLWTERISDQKIQLIEASTDEQEAEKFISLIQNLHHARNTSYNNFAILYRTNSQSLQFERALRSAQIPYQVLGGLRFYERKEIKDVLAYLRTLANPSDDVSLLRIINYPPRGIGQKVIQQLIALSRSDDISASHALTSIRTSDNITSRSRKALDNFVSMLRKFNDLKSKNNFLGLVQNIIEVTCLRERLMQEEKDDPSRAETKSANLDNLVTEIGRFCEINPEGTLEDFLEEVTLVTAGDEYEEDAEKVSILTIHSAKGLEFPVVFIGGLEEGLLPLRPYDDTAGMDIEEERRLFYVAATRAEDRLVLGYAIDRNRWGGKFWEGPSRFLNEIPEEIVETIFTNKYSRNTARYRQSAESRASAYNRMSNQRTEPVTSNELTRDDLHHGLLVKHPKFGLGIVLKHKQSASDTYIDVDFDDVGEKTLLLRLAKLEAVR